MLKDIAVCVCVSVNFELCNFFLILNEREKDNKILVLFGIRSNKFIHYSFHLGIEERTETT